MVPMQCKVVLTTLPATIVLALMPIWAQTCCSKQLTQHEQTKHSCWTVQRLLYATTALVPKNIILVLKCHHSEVPMQSECSDW